MKKIVVAEDSFFIRRHIVSSLMADFEVHAANDAHQALSLIDQNEADWLVLNPALSKNSGLELLYELHCWLDLRSVKTILLAQNADYYAKHKENLKELNIRHVIPLAALETSSLAALMGGH